MRTFPDGRTIQILILPLPSVLGADDPAAVDRAYEETIEQVLAEAWATSVAFHEDGTTWSLDTLRVVPIIYRGLISVEHRRRLLVVITGHATPPRRR